MKLFPSLETMLEVTATLQIYDPLATLKSGGTSFESGCTDRKEFDMWKARWIDGRRVIGTIEGVMDCPQLFVVAVVKGRLS